MNFESALVELKSGRWIRRAGWNGKGMYIYIEDGFYQLQPNFNGENVTFVHIKYEPCIVMFTAQGKHQPGWLASQADMLADDWEIVPLDEKK